VIDELTSFLNCSALNLSRYMNNPLTRIRILTKFLDRKIRTTYLNKDMRKKTFLFGGLTWQGANKIRVYGRLRCPYNVTITQHYYIRHKIRLRNPYMNCVIEHRPWKKDRYYPIELLEFVDEEDEKMMNLAIDFEKVRISE